MTLPELVVDIIGDLVEAYPGVMPADAADECVVYQIIDAPELGVGKRVASRVQLTCWARGDGAYGAACALANQVRALFYDRKETVDGLAYRCQVIDGGYDAEPSLDDGRYGRIVEVIVRYRNPV